MSLCPARDEEGSSPGPLLPAILDPSDLDLSDLALHSTFHRPHSVSRLRYLLVSDSPSKLSPFRYNTTTVFDDVPIQLLDQLGSGDGRRGAYTSSRTTDVRTLLLELLVISMMMLYVFDRGTELVLDLDV
jgi:hypothetical protein